MNAIFRIWPTEIPVHIFKYNYKGIVCNYKKIKMNVYQYENG